MRCVLVLTATTRAAGDRRQPAARQAVWRDDSAGALDRSDAGRRTGRSGRGGSRRRGTGRGTRALRDPGRRLERRRRVRLHRRDARSSSINCRHAGIAPSRLYYASGSRGTQAGLTLGAKLCDAPYRVYGVAVSAGEPEKIERAKRIANEAAALTGIAGATGARGSRHRSGLHRRRLRHSDRQKALEAIALLARTRSDPARSLLHVEGDGRDDRPRARRRDWRRTRRWCSCTPAACRHSSRRDSSRRSKAARPQRYCFTVVSVGIGSIHLRGNALVADRPLELFPLPLEIRRVPAARPRAPSRRPSCRWPNVLHPQRRASSVAIELCVSRFAIGSPPRRAATSARTERSPWSGPPATLVDTISSALTHRPLLLLM